MDRFNALGRGAQIMFVGTVLLLIDMFLPWQDVDIGGLAEEFGVDASVSGWHGAMGVLLGIVTIITLAWLIVRLASVDIPLPVSTAMTGALLGTLVLIFAVIKILTILGDYTTLWAWIGLGLAIVVAVGAFQVVQEAGGVDQLRTEATAMSSSSSPTASPAAPSEPAATAPAPPPAAPAAPTEQAPPAYEPEASAPETERETEPPPPSPPENRPV
jgi:hypothetical protein